MTETITRAVVEDAIRSYIEPHLATDLVTAKTLKQVTIAGGAVSLKLQLGFPARGCVDAIKAAVATRVGALDGVVSVDVEIDSTVHAHAVQANLQALQNVKNVIAVASGKGGVGKSTVAVNLALALIAEGGKAGLLDADIYGPSQPRMLGASGRPDSTDGKSLEPVVSYGVQSMSIGYLIDEETPMIWRGPMVTQALEQLLSDTNWRDLDYLLIDLPPGTGDTQLTLAQKIPVSGAVIVTTPQDIALLDARKGLKMFNKVKVPVLGIIENMSTHICSQCGHQESIFGSGGGERMAADCQVPLLGKIPLDSAICADVDTGKPTVINTPNGAIAQSYRQIARHTAARLSQHARNYSKAFPKIVISNN